MDPAKAPPQIFDRDLLRVRRERAARRGASFLAIRCAEDAIERICDINRTFNHALFVGPPEFCSAVLAGLPEEKTPAAISMDFDGDEEAYPGIDAPDELSSHTLETYDLIVSGLCLHNVNDLPGALIAIRRALKPDGLFIGAMFGGATLTELRQAAYSADDAIIGGMTPRVLPFADYSQAAALLQRSGLALPVVDTDRVTVRYKEFGTLLSDLRDMGETNCLQQRNPQIVGKAWRKALIEAYQRDNYVGSRFVTTFEILWMTGWAPHESQQKPLKPGSAKMRLADVLGTVEKPIS